MMTPLKIILLIIGSYLFGNINNALMISRLRKTDIRKYGSGNPGTMNMTRNFGKKWGALTLTLDALKGIVPCLVGWWLLGGFGADKTGMYIAGISVITGHIYPVFLKFKGGKGIASAIGICFAINPLATLIMFIIGIAFISLTHIGTVTSFIIVSVPIALEAFKVSQSGSLINCILLFAIFMFPLLAHRANIIKLFRGDENKTVLFKKTQRKSP